MYCPRCGALAGDDAKFCGQCGRALRVRHEQTAAAPPDGAGLLAARRWHYFLGAAVIVAGVAACSGVFAAGVYDVAASIAPPHVFDVPGRHLIELDAGDYTLFHLTLPALEVRLTDAAGRVVPMSEATAYTPYEFLNRPGMAVLEFAIAEQGAYTLTADYVQGREGPDVALAIGEFRVDELVGAFASLASTALAILGATGVVGGLIILVTYLRRRRRGESGPQVIHS